nr:ribonuclease H-like domain-containing protein [Tanacetum cinerariifolium]
LSRYKARLVANDSSQQLGVDFDETFNPLVKLATIRMIAGYANRIGFSHSRSASSLFIYTQGSQVDYLLIYVDDIILTTSSTALLQQIIDSLHKEFDMTDLGVLNYFLGVSATRHSTGQANGNRGDKHENQEISMVWREVLIYEENEGDGSKGTQKFEDGSSRNWNYEMEASHAYQVDMHLNDEKIENEALHSRGDRDVGAKWRN